ncbi:uncharacterized protein LOC143284153 [Babylonia areolata]|uniref:uncharacterized protein LOC143284153 n=1 Tax=Babylonia areolata TaxID=304850 RepID=UPI003FD2CC18
MTAFELLFCSLLIALVQGQVPTHRGRQGRRHQAHIEHRQNASDGDGLILVEGVATENVVPRTWRDLLTMNNVSNISDFFSLLVDSERQPVRMEDYVVESETLAGKKVIAGSENILAESDECSPRNMSVRLDVNMEDPTMVYYPECTRIERCGGCTPTPYLSCVPVYKEVVIMSVLKASYPFPGSTTMNMNGFEQVPVERHLTCRLECSLKQEDCGPYHFFLRNQCRCQCKSSTACSNGRVWDEYLCGCRCRNMDSCCRNEEQQGRICPFFFDPEYCECSLKVSVGFLPNTSQAEIAAWLASRRQSNTTLLPDNTTPPTIPAQHLSGTTPTNTTTIITTTTPNPTTRDSCSGHICPRFMRPVAYRGRCFCQSRNNHSQRHPRRHPQRHRLGQ